MKGSEANPTVDRRQSTPTTSLDKLPRQVESWSKLKPPQMSWILNTYLPNSSSASRSKYTPLVIP